MSDFTVKQAWEEVGGLSKPSKMPSYGYSLSAYECNVGSKLRLVENSPCSTCYALKGRYVFPNVQGALDRRMDKLLHNPKWVDAMVFLVLNYCTKSGVFRWHDSGDIQSLDHLEKIATIAIRTPNVKHWLPTQEGALVKQYKKKHGSFPPNLIVRLSASMVNGVPPKHHEHSSTVATSKDLAIGYMCPSSTHGNKCADCRACRDFGVANITYLKH